MARGKAERPDPEARSATTVARRDTRYRRSLALSDAATAALAAILALEVFGASSWAGAALLCAPMIVFVNKTVGLYDRDEYRLHKTTLDEAPTIFLVASVFSLIVWLAAGAFAATDVGRGEVLLLWALLFALPASGRTFVRYVVRQSAAVERCLVIGDPLSADRLRRKLAEGRAMNATIVGLVPLWDRTHPLRELHVANANGNGHGPTPMLGEMETLGLVLVEHDIHRVIFVPRTADSDEMLDAIRLVKALGVKVSVLPRLFEVVGSSVEFDDVDGVTLLGVRRRSLSAGRRELLKRGMDVGVGARGCSPCWPR